MNHLYNNNVEMLIPVCTGKDIFNKVEDHLNDSFRKNNYMIRNIRTEIN